MERLKVTSSGHWFKLAYYSLALRRPGYVRSKLDVPELSRPVSRGLVPSILQRAKGLFLAAIFAVSPAGACLTPASAADPPAKASEDDACVELFGVMYWTFRDEGVYRACRDGSQAKLIVPMKNVDGLAVDEQGRKLYFTLSTVPEVNTDKVLRANLDGSGVEELAQGLNFTGDLALDAKGGKLYISSVGDGKIMQCNLDGSERKDLLTGLENPDELAIVVEHCNLYCVRGGKVQRANLDCTQIEDVATINTYAMGLALDLESKRMYYATLNEGTIQRVNLDGKADQQIVGSRTGTDGLAYDPFSRKLYWTEEGKICQANDDGSEIETLVAGKTHKFASIVILQPKETP